jgi:hypothetical protein
MGFLSGGKTVYVGRVQSCSYILTWAVKKPGMKIMIKKSREKYFIRQVTDQFSR